MKTNLVTSLEELAIFNDKGIHWGSHTNDEIAEIRRAKIKVIGEQLQLAAHSLETEMLKHALKNGELEKDDTGKFVDLARTIGT